MLDKQAEKVLKIAIAEYDGDSEKIIEIRPDDVKVKSSHLKSICELLQKQGYITVLDAPRSQGESCIIELQHEGAAYFKVKRKKFIWALFNNLWIPLTLDILVRIIPTLLKCLLSMVQK